MASETGAMRASRIDDVARVGFITAIWASFGVAVLAMFAMENGDAIRRLMWESWHVVIPFLLGVYGSSYLFGRAFLWREAHKNVFLSIPLALVVSELVVGVGALLGGLGHLTAELVRCAGDLSTALTTAVAAPLIMMAYGLVFTMPLAIGLGIHIRVWSHQRERAAR